MRRVIAPTRIRFRALIAVLVSASSLVIALFVALPTAQAAPGPLQTMNLSGVCNSGSWELAVKIDAALTANKSALRMIQTDQPQKGETGYNDATVTLAFSLLRDALGKTPTDADVTDPANAQKVSDAITAALNARRLGGNWTLSATDDSGNSVYLWCLNAGNGHGGPDLALLYVAKGQTQATGAWIAGCVQAGGENSYKVSVDDKTGVFVKFEWENVGLDPKPVGADTVIRYLYTYDVGKNILNIVKDYGSIVNKKFVPNAARSVPEKNPAAPPALFKGLMLNGKQISLLNGPDAGVPSRSEAVAVVDPVTPTTLDLTNPPMADAFTPVGTPEGIDSTFQPGDTIALNMPPGTVPIANGTNPDWTLLTPDQPIAVFEYIGTTPLDIAIGDVIPDVTVLTAASSSPSFSPSPTPSPSPSFSPSPSPSPSFTPSPIISPDPSITATP